MSTKLPSRRTSPKRRRDRPPEPIIPGTQPSPREIRSSAPESPPESPRNDREQRPIGKRQPVKTALGNAQPVPTRGHLVEPVAAERADVDRGQADDAEVELQVADDEHAAEPRRRTGEAREQQEGREVPAAALPATSPHVVVTPLDRRGLREAARQRPVSPSAPQPLSPSPCDRSSSDSRGRSAVRNGPGAGKPKPRPIKQLSKLWLWVSKLSSKLMNHSLIANSPIN